MSFSEADPAVAGHVLREIGQGFLGESREAVAVREQIAGFLARHWTEQTPPPILLRGEVGVGKSLLARLIHQAGPRRDGPFVPFDCTAFPESVIEGALFGYELGSFTDARRARPGAFQTANHGTLYLDEVTMLPEALQGRLLKVIEERSVRGVGGTSDEQVDVWIIAATIENLGTAADYRRRYREAFDQHDPSVTENLHQHLGKLDLLIPPLRQRPEDILLLVEHFLMRVCTEHRLPPKSFAADARGALLAYTWPGNVREVRHQMERMALLFESDVITATMLELPI